MAGKARLLDLFCGAGGAAMGYSRVPEPFVKDSDFTLYVGDVREVLAGLPAESVDCVVTSPPYWGLRDYGTGEWDGGDAECDHRKPTTTYNQNFNERWGQGGGDKKQEHKNDGQYPHLCGKCGARRIDRQLGLEPTPEEYAANMVEVFREVRRVLAAHGTCWINLGDSYASNPEKGGSGPGAKQGAHRNYGRPQVRDNKAAAGMGAPQPPPGAAGLKPKDLVGIPWRVAFALQADGWYLRADIIWSKPNPMPESVTDRPTKAHEYVFLLSKQPRYFFDQEAVRETIAASTLPRLAYQGNGAKVDASRNDAAPDMAKAPHPAGRNIRSVWEIATQPYPEAHFATYPEALVERCLKAGCPEQVCRTCGKPRERIVERSIDDSRPRARQNIKPPEVTKAGQGTNANGSETWGHWLKSETLGWSECSCSVGVESVILERGGVEVDADAVADELAGAHVVGSGIGVDALPHGGADSDCESLRLGHTPSVTHPSKYRPGVVLDPFLGSGTTALVARRLGRHCVGIELNQSYAEMAAKRLSQLSLLA